LKYVLNKQGVGVRIGFIWLTPVKGRGNKYSGSIIVGNSQSSSKPPGFLIKQKASHDFKATPIPYVDD
jgi:hypothetical protein